MSFVAKRLQFIDSRDFRKAFFRREFLESPIDLSIGIPEELTAEHIKAAGIEAIRADKTAYVPSNGLPELRAAIAEKLEKDNQIHSSPDAITVVPGLTTGQLLVYLAILDPGDEIIVFDPYYPPYPHLANMAGGHVLYVSTLPDFQPNLPAVEASVTNRTKAIIINSPNNPTGAVYSAETLRKIAEIAERNNLLVISDEIYEHFTYDIKHFSIGSIYPNTLTLNGFSKEFAMTGWRVGYINGPTDIIDAINELQQYVVMSSSSIAQHAALAALNHRPDIQYKYKTKRDLMVSGLEQLGFKVHGGQGAFYLFVQAPNSMTDLEFVEKAAEHNLVLLPGRAFSRLHGFIRISYGASISSINSGLSILEKISKSS